jgi:hypothetical protein
MFGCVRIGCARIVPLDAYECIVGHNGYGEDAVVYAMTVCHVINVVDVCVSGVHVLFLWMHMSALWVIMGVVKMLLCMQRLYAT